MGKGHRGKPIRSMEARGRGKCPLCQRTAVKLLYPRTYRGERLTVCKRCGG